MIQSETFGRTFWLDANDNFKSAPTFVNNNVDYDNRDYVSEWTDWEGINVNELFAIYRELLTTKINQFYSAKMQSINVLSAAGKKAAGIQLGNCHTSFPMGSIFVYHKNMKNHKLTLTENQYAILLEIFQFVSSLDLYGDDTMDHADYQFDELWDSVLDAKEEIS